MDTWTWILLGIVSVCKCANYDKGAKIDLTISSRLNRIEISWFNIIPTNGVILLTDLDTETDYFSLTKIRPPSSLQSDDKYYEQSNETSAPSISDQWLMLPNNRLVLYSVVIDQPNGWHTTNIPFDSDLLKNITITTRCYGYWAVYLDAIGERKLSTCIRAHPTWMTEMKERIGKFKFRDLFMVGTHDSGSYRDNFDATHNETLVTKYSITQDLDIRNQLLHGVRYLDIRVGYYRASDHNFWVNHGISRQQPLHTVLHQVRDFVLETNELVIFDIQEFPVGFGKKLDVHRKLVQFVHQEIGDLMIDPNITWQGRLEDIWNTKRNIIVSYDLIGIVEEFPTILWHSVQQRWGNVQSVADLRRYLSPSSRNFILFTSRPIADMAELTPNTWDVITDRFGGLRRMADDTNREVSSWYFNDWGPSTNIVAVDFFRGTSLMETSIYWNSRKQVL